MQPIAITEEQKTQYREEGYTILRGVLDEGAIKACLEALAALAADATIVQGGRRGGPTIEIEPAVAQEAASHDPATRTDRIRKFADFIDASPALLHAAMNATLHDALDRLMGPGRGLVCEMALVKPPRIGSEKRWHQDAAYFRVDKPERVFGVWLALDPATTENGCMEVVPRSHKSGPVPHVPELDIDQCSIRSDFVRHEDRVAIPLAPGDALVFNSLTYHYSAANKSEHGRRALQFHYHQDGVNWINLAAHTKLFHDESGAYAGCTVPKGMPAVEANSFESNRRRPVVTIA